MTERPLLLIQGSADHESKSQQKPGKTQKLVLYRSFSLVIYFMYSSAYVSISIFQFIPPSFPPVTISFVFCICDSGKFSSFVPFFLKSTYKQHHMILVFLCLSASLRPHELWLFNIPGREVPLVISQDSVMGLLPGHWWFEQVSQG